MPELNLNLPPGYLEVFFNEKINEKIKFNNLFFKTF